MQINAKKAKKKKKRKRIVRAPLVRRLQPVYVQRSEWYFVCGGMVIILK